MEFRVEDNIPEVMRYLTEVERKVLPRAHAKALTFTAEEVERAEMQAMNQAFDGMTKWTMNALAKKSATEASQEASVFMKDTWSASVPASNYLTPHIRGGGRLMKKSERSLQRAGLLGNAGYWVPGAGANLDALGNIKGGEIRRILSQVKAGERHNWQTAKSRKRQTRKGVGQHFIPRPGSKLRPGVYRREAGRRIVPVLIFVNQVNYRKRFDFYGVAEKTAARMFPEKWAKSLDRELMRLKTPH